MDSNIVLKGVDSYGSGVFKEYDVNGKELRTIRLDFRNMVGRDYACRNFSYLNGRVNYRGKIFDSLESFVNIMVNGKRNRAIAEEKSEAGIEDIGAFISSMKLMSGRNGNVAEIPTPCKHHIYMSVDSNRNVIVGVPDDVQNIGGLWNAFTRMGVNTTQELGTITMIGGGHRLQDLSNLCSNLMLDRIDMTKLDVTNVNNASRMFRNCWIRMLDLQWAQRCRIDTAEEMFMQYKGRTIPLNQMNLALLQNADSMFHSSTAFIETDGMAPNSTPFLSFAAEMFKCYQNPKKCLWVGWLGLGGVESIEGMFAHANIGAVDVRGWNVSNIANIRDTFLDFTGNILGLEDGQLCWDKLRNANRAFLRATVNSRIKLICRGDSLVDFHEMLVNAHIREIDISELKVNTLSMLGRYEKSNIAKWFKGRIVASRKQRGLLDGWLRPNKYSELILVD